MPYVVILIPKHSFCNTVCVCMVMQIKLVVVVVACALIVTDTCVKFDTRCSPENRVISVTYLVAR